MYCLAAGLAGDVAVAAGFFVQGAYLLVAFCGGGLSGGVYSDGDGEFSGGAGGEGLADPEFAGGIVFLKKLGDCRGNAIKYYNFNTEQGYLLSESSDCIPQF